MTQRYVPPRIREMDANGNSMAGAKLHAREPLAHTTPKNTYSDADLTTPSPNPVVYNSAGLPPDIFLSSGEYYFELHDGSDNLIWSADHVSGQTSGEVRSINANATLLATDRSKRILVDTSGGAVVFGLLAASVAGNGFEFEIKKDASDNLLTLDPAGAETFWEGGNFLWVGPLESIRLRSDGVEWSYVLDGKWVEPGTEKSWISPTPPPGWLLEHGQAISRMVYARLFSVITTNFGVGDNSSTFNLPDWRGYTEVGSDSMGVLRANRIQISTTISTASGSNSATLASAVGVALGMFVSSPNVPANTTVTAISGTTITMSANASATASTVDARLSMLTDAETAGSSGGELTHTQSLAELYPHTHSDDQVTGANNANWSAGANATLTTHVTGTTSTTGGGLPMNNLQPSQVRHKIIKV